MKQWQIYVLAAFSGGIVCQAVKAQQATIIIDWNTHQLVNPTPINIDSRAAVNVEVDSVNDYLYSYNGYIATTGVQTPPVHLLAAGPCTNGSVESKLNSINIAALNPLSAGGTPKSISLQVFETEYHQDKDFISTLKATDLTGCGDANVSKGTYLIANALAWAKLDGTAHKYQFQGTLEPLTNYQVTISEKYNGALTDVKCSATQPSGGTCAIQYNPSTDILTNSQGFLMTTLPGYSYARATVPNSTDAQLQVTSTGPVRVAAAALFNVQVPWPWLEKESYNYRLAFSFGPAYELDSNDQAGNRLGFFGGLSLVMYKRFVITPGVHIAQYSGFPSGFSKNGQDIPSSFTGSLNPTTKNTVKFGITLSFKDWNIVSSSSSGQVVAPK